MSFLHVLTRVYRRPGFLYENMHSLAEQTDPDWEQTFLIDAVGKGIGPSYERLAEQGPELVRGEYIWLLDDDDLCIRPILVAELKAIACQSDPDLFMVKMDHGPERGILPGKNWLKPPALGGFGCSAYIVRRGLWQTFARNFGGHYAGDFDFLDALWAANPNVYWHDVIASRVQRISRGAAE